VPILEVLALATKAARLGPRFDNDIDALFKQFTIKGRIRIVRELLAAGAFAGSEQ